MKHLGLGNPLIFQVNEVGPNFIIECGNSLDELPAFHSLCAINTIAHLGTPQLPSHVGQNLATFRSSNNDISAFSNLENPHRKAHALDFNTLAAADLSQGEQDEHADAPEAVARGRIQVVRGSIPTRRLLLQRLCRSFRPMAYRVLCVWDALIGRSFWRVSSLKRLSGSWLLCVRVRRREQR